MAASLRVLVVDDHDVVHWGFRLLLKRQTWVERCVAAPTGAEALELARRAEARRRAGRPASSAASRAPSCASELHARPPRTRVLLISGRRLDLAGGRSRGRGVGVRLQGLGRRRHRAGGAGRRRSGRRSTAAPESAASRCRAASARSSTLIAAGATNAEIAPRLYLSPHTVKEHTSSIYRKLGVRNRAEAVKARAAARAWSRRPAREPPPDGPEAPPTRGVAGPEPLTSSSRAGKYRDMPIRPRQPTPPCSSPARGARAPRCASWSTRAPARSARAGARRTRAPTPSSTSSDGTAYAQPAIYCASLAAWHRAGRPARPRSSPATRSASSPHSSPPAAIDPTDGLRLTMTRGRLMAGGRER